MLAFEQPTHLTIEYVRGSTCRRNQSLWHKQSALLHVSTNFKRNNAAKRVTEDLVRPEEMRPADVLR